MLALVLAVGVTILWDYFTGRIPGGAFVLLWLLIWLALTVVLAAIWLWTGWGKEIVTVAGGALTVRRDLLGLGKTKSYPAADMRNLRSAGFFGDPWGWSGYLRYWGLAGGNVAFEHAGTTHRFGLLVEEDEARQIVEKITPYLRPLQRGA
jgi:hypothetical protein